MATQRYATRASPVLCVRGQGTYTLRVRRRTGRFGRGNSDCLQFIYLLKQNYWDSQLDRDADVVFQDGLLVGGSLVVRANTDYDTVHYGTVEGEGDKVFMLLRSHKTGNYEIIKEMRKRQEWWEVEESYLQ